MVELFLLRTSAGKVSPPTLTVDTLGVFSAFNASTVDGTAAMGAATGIPRPFTSWQVEHRPKLRTASENSARPRVASADRLAEAGAGAAFVVITGFSTPFSLATYATTAVNSVRESVFANDCIAVFGTPRLTVLPMYA